MERYGTQFSDSEQPQTTELTHDNFSAGDFGKSKTVTFNVGKGLQRLEFPLTLEAVLPRECRCHV